MTPQPKPLDPKRPWHSKGKPEYLREQLREEELRTQEDREYEETERYWRWS